jgi:hypothetical protein
MAATGGANSDLSETPDVGNSNPDVTTGTRPVAGGAMSPAFGRRSADLATDQPAGHAEVDVRGDDSPLPGSDDVTGGWVPNIDTSAGGDIRRGRPRELHPEVDPDTRLGLHPTVRSEDLPDGPEGRTV